MDLSINLAGIKMKNPVMVASGTFNLEYAKIFDLNKLGAIITKSITLKPRAGNPPPRIVETPFGILNSIGLENAGIESFVLKELPLYKKLKLPLIVSIAGKTEQEYVDLIKILEKEAGISAYELNLSCPNIKKGGIVFSQSPEILSSLIKKTLTLTRLPLIAKLTPEVNDIVKIAKTAEKNGISALALSNTFLGMSIDYKKRKPRLGNIFGGLSGPAIKPLALRIVYQAARRVKIPIIGMGGITNFMDALEFIIAGAAAISIGTANFINPKTALEVIQGIKDYLRKNNLSLKKLRESLK
ncbi:MAG: dihydroorotate dehydrogenase [Armatimonadetes bacterium]|nr:dihydroorotate dehydrogenase [Armatimonadota bacterium]